MKFALALTDADCDLTDARCRNEVCKCPSNRVGVRNSPYVRNCQFIVQFRAYCNPGFSICDETKNLKCSAERYCDCAEFQVYDYDRNVCMTRRRFIQQNGRYKLGAWNNYCRTTSDCRGQGMECISKKCKCTLGCEVKNFGEDHQECVCPESDRKKKILLTSILPLVVSVVLIFCLICFCWYKIRQRWQEADEEQASNQSSSPSPPTSPQTVTDRRPSPIPPPPTPPREYTLPEGLEPSNLRIAYQPSNNSSSTPLLYLPPDHSRDQPTLFLPASDSSSQPFLLHPSSTPPSSTGRGFATSTPARPLYPPSAPLAPADDLPPSYDEAVEQGKTSGEDLSTHLRRS